MHHDTTPPLPLSGLRVLDFGQGVAGPYCAQLLGDQGADVIKVEPPRGDWGRNLGQMDERGYSGTFVSVNRNKRGICLDLKQPRALELVQRLAHQADIVVENFRDGVMESLGLGYEHLRVHNPRLVYVGISGFGRQGPNTDLPAGDSTMQAYGGLMSIIGEPDGEPLRVGTVVTDMVAGTDAFSGALLALLRRGSTGQGSRVDVALLDSLLAFQAPPFTEFLLTGQLPRRMGNEHPLISPSGAMRTRDSSIVLTVIDHQWSEFCAKIGMPALQDDPRLATSTLRQHNRQLLRDILQPVFAERTTAEWLAILRRFDVPCAPINDYQALLADEQVGINRILQRSEPGHAFPLIRNPVRLSGSDLPRRAPPRRGEHTRAVLRERLGLAAGDVDALIDAGVALEPPAEAP